MLAPDVVASVLGGDAVAAGLGNLAELGRRDAALPGVCGSIRLRGEAPVRGGIRLGDHQQKLRDELLEQGIFYTLDEARALIERWRREVHAPERFQQP